MPMLTKEERCSLGCEGCDAVSCPLISEVHKKAIEVRQRLVAGEHINNSLLNENWEED